MEGKISREFLKGSHASYELSPCSSFQPGFVWWTCTVNSFHKLICIMVEASEAYWPKSRKICLSETTWKKGTGDRQWWEKHLTFYFLLNDSLWIYLKKLSCFILPNFFLCISFFIFLGFPLCLHFFIPWSSVFFSLFFRAWLTVKLDMGRGNYLWKCQRVAEKRHIFAHFTRNMFNSTWIESKTARYRKVIKEILLLSILKSLNYHWHK